MLKARDIMTKDPVVVSPQTKINEAAAILLENRFNGLPVVDETGNLVGIISQDDLIFQQKKIPVPSFFTVLDGTISLFSEKKIQREVEKIAATTVEEAMTPDPITITPETSVEDIATLMVRKNIHTLPVVDGTRLVGIVGKEDILKTLMGETDQGM